MKLPIKKKYFDDIRLGKKHYEYRDAHITFICEETGETLRRKVTAVELKDNVQHQFPDVLQDDETICFYLGDDEE